MNDFNEMNVELHLTERELICLANHSLDEVGAQLDRVRGAMDQIEAAKKANDVPDGKMNRTLYKQDGNSMPVPVLEEIFRNLKL